MKGIKRVVIVILFSLVFFSSSCYVVGGEKTYGDVTVSLVSVYDGDTFTVNIDSYPSIIGERISVRIYGIDTPEMKGKSKKEKELALKAKEWTKNTLESAQRIELKNMRRDKYFRILADVYVDGKSLGEQLIKKGLAKPYFGGRKEKWE